MDYGQQITAFSKVITITQHSFELKTLLRARAMSNLNEGNVGDVPRFGMCLRGIH